MAAISEIASLETVKNYLRMPDPSGASVDDEVLTNVFIPAATSVIEREIGHVISKTITAERHSGGKIEIFLRQLPVLYVQNIEEGWGYYNWNLTYQTVNTQPALDLWSFSLDNPRNGRVTRRAPGNVAFPFVAGINNIRVDYVVGRDELPPNAQLAFLELLAHWYRGSQLRTVNQPTTSFSAVDSTDFTRTGGVEGINLGVPTEIIELLKPDRRRPIIG